jgi:hypothetical protein
MSELQPPYGEIWDLLKSGQVIPFLGAGASLSARAPDDQWDPGQPKVLPKSAELGVELARLANFPGDEPAEDLAKVAQYYTLVAGRPRLRQRLRGFFGRSFAFASIHQLLAQVPVPLLIVTTNYDDLIERAFQAAGRRYDLVIYPTDNQEWSGSVIWWKYGAEKPEFSTPNSLQVDLSAGTVIYKIHGAVDPVNEVIRDSFVITEDDYTDFLVRLATQTAIPAIFAEPFRRRNFLFLGYSLRDWNFRLILSKIEKDLPPEEALRSWAVQHQPSLLEKALWQHRNVTIYDLTIQDFVERLRMEQLAEG